MGIRFNTNTWRAPLLLIDSWLPPSFERVGAARSLPQILQRFVRAGWLTLPPKSPADSRTGVITGSVTNMMTGKGVFNVSYQGEVLTGEATRVSNEERRGVASAFSPQGLFMSCEYQMNTPYQGAGTCTFSNGAAYQMHIGGNQ